MKKLILLLVMLCPVVGYAQMKGGYHDIVKAESILGGEVFQSSKDMLGSAFVYLDEENGIINISFAKFTLFLFRIESVTESDGIYRYNVLCAQTGEKMTLMYSPHKEIDNAGELMIPRSKGYYDFYKILKKE